MVGKRRAVERKTRSRSSCGRAQTTRRQREVSESKLIDNAQRGMLEERLPRACEQDTRLGRDDGLQRGATEIVILL